jgi:hypothetical protein
MAASVSPARISRPRWSLVQPLKEPNKSDARRRLAIPILPRGCASRLSYKAKCHGRPNRSRAGSMRLLVGGRCGNSLHDVQMGMAKGLRPAERPSRPTRVAPVIACDDRSQNITVTCRRSPEASAGADVGAVTGAADAGAGTCSAAPALPKSAIARRSLRRCPSRTPISLRS